MHFYSPAFTMSNKAYYLWYRYYFLPVCPSVTHVRNTCKSLLLKTTQDFVMNMLNLVNILCDYIFKDIEQFKRGFPPYPLDFYGSIDQFRLESI